MEQKPLLIVVGSSYAPYRSYIFEAISTRYRLWLMNPTPPTWEDPFIQSFTVVDCLDACLEEAIAGDNPDFSRQAPKPRRCRSKETDYSRFTRVPGRS